MKKLFLLFFVSSFCSSSVLAAEVMLSWEINSELAIHEVFIYQSNESKVYDYNNPTIIIPEIIIDNSCIIKTQTIIKDLDKDKVYYWVARCKNSAGIMSIDSNEISTKKPPPPSKLELFKYIP